MKKRRGLSILTFLLVIALCVTGCNKQEPATTDGDEQATINIENLLARDSEVVDIFYNGHVDYNENDTLEGMYYAVTDGRFATMSELEAYMSGIYSSAGEDFLGALLLDGMFIERDGVLYVAKDMIGQAEYPLPDLASLTYNEDAAGVLTIKYTYGDELTANLTASKVDGAWRLDKSHGQVLAEAGLLLASGADGEGDIYIYDGDVNEYKQMLGDTSDPASIVAAIGSTLGIEIVLNDAYLEGDAIIVDFDGNSPPVTSVNGTEESKILNSIAKSLLAAEPAADVVYFRVDGGDYVSGHYELGASEAFPVN